MKIGLDEPYSYERALQLNTLIRMRSPDAVINCDGVPYHKASRKNQKLYWGTFLKMAIERLESE